MRFSTAGLRAATAPRTGDEFLDFDVEGERLPGRVFATRCFGASGETSE